MDTEEVLNYVYTDNIEISMGGVNMGGKPNSSSGYHHGNLREELIKKAIATIEKKGVEALSLRGLAREIGVSHSAPMRHFPSRSALLTAIAQHGVDSLLGSASKHVGRSDLTNLEKLQEMAKGYVTWATLNPAHHMLIRNQDVMRHADDSLRSQLNSYAQLHEQTIAKAQADGWRRDGATRAVFLHLTAQTAGLALVASDPIYETVFQGRPSDQEITDALSACFTEVGSVANISSG
ncbi:TetR/AcrR family transcriptional regulator [Roseovarius sp. EL26]|uniref:TetR/AcrR family transcriptional regulator n=1 Tax=Roseovarius sp. EL26 TaxID=2126672 RepID=UPI001C201262|nr:TetR/AcrR family transcriptional regulator [Roseovarius sp. EL26]